MPIPLKIYFRPRLLLVVAKVLINKA
jgi:hypothetical protein